MTSTPAYDQSSARHAAGRRRFRLRRKSPDAIQAILDERLHAQADRAARRADLIGTTHDARPLDDLDQADVVEEVDDEQLAEWETAQEAALARDEAQRQTERDEEVDTAGDGAAATDRLMHDYAQHLAEQEQARMAALAALPADLRDQVLDDLRSRTVGQAAHVDLDRMHAALDQLRTDDRAADGYAPAAQDEYREHGRFGANLAEDSDEDGTGR